MTLIACKEEIEIAESLLEKHGKKAQAIDPYPSPYALCPCGSKKKYKQCCQKEENRPFEPLEKGLSQVLPDQNLYFLENPQDYALLTTSLKTLHHPLSHKALTRLRKEHPKNPIFPFLIATHFRLSHDINAFEKFVSQTKDDASFFPTTLLRWWYLVEQGVLLQHGNLETIIQNRKELCWTEFSIWGLIKIQNALNKERFVEGESYLVSLIQTAEKCGVPNHWSLEEGEAQLEAAYFFRRLKILRQRQR